jgi:hypothetical protein
MYNFNLYLQFGAPNSSAPCTSIANGTNLLPVQAGAACPGGSLGGGGGCVALGSYLYNGIRPTQINIGELMDTFDPETLEKTHASVTYSSPELQPCIRLETISGIALVCSESAPIPTKDGTLTHAANLTTQDQIPVMKNDIFGWEQLKEILPVGPQMVQKISCDDKCFWAGEKDGEYILHHNVIRVKMSYSGQK